MEKPVIRYYMKNTYGNALFYPIDFTDELLMLTSRKTLTFRDMRALRGMGFQLEEVLESSIKK